MHIGFISSEYPHEIFKGQIGGIGTFTKNLAELLNKNNHQVTVFIHSQSFEKNIVENGINIHFVKRVSFKGITWLTNRLYFNKYVNRIIKKDKINVLESPEWGGFTALMNFYCPLVIRLHGSDTYFCHLDNRKVKFKNRLYEKLALLGANKIVGVSEFVAKKTKYLFKLNKKIEIIYNTIDAEKFKPNHIEVTPKTLLYFGTIARKKGVLEIAKAFNKAIEKDNEIKLYCLGRDNIDNRSKISTLKMLKKILTKQALDNFIYIDAVPYDEVIAYIQKSDIVLLPSFAEAFPMTWLEAMALEKKMITSNIGWANELMVNNETGFTIDPTNNEDFTAKILALINNETKAVCMARAARIKIITEFNSDNSYSNNIDLYNSLTA